MSIFLDLITSFKMTRSTRLLRQRHHENFSQSHIPIPGTLGPLTSLPINCGNGAMPFLIQPPKTLLTTSTCTISSHQEE